MVNLDCFRGTRKVKPLFKSLRKAGKRLSVQQLRRQGQKGQKKIPDFEPEELGRLGVGASNDEFSNKREALKILDGSGLNGYLKSAVGQNFKLKRNYLSCLNRAVSFAQFLYEKVYMNISVYAASVKILALSEEI